MKRQRFRTVEFPVEDWGKMIFAGKARTGTGLLTEKEDSSLIVINELNILLSIMNCPVIFLLFCWGFAGSGVALPDLFPEACGPVYGCGVTPQGRSRWTRPAREWKYPGRLGTGTAEGKEGGQWLRDPFSRDSGMGCVRYQWSYRRGRLMKVPHALAVPDFYFSGRFPCAVDREELEDALEDTLIVAENPFPEEGRSHIFLYRGKVCHSLDEVGENAGALSIRYVVFSPDVADEEQASVRAAFFGATGFYVMKDMFSSGRRKAQGEHIFLSGPRQEETVVFMEGLGAVPVSLFMAPDWAVGEVWNREKFFQPPARGIPHGSLSKVRSRSVIPH